MNSLEAAIQYLIYSHHNFKTVIPNVHTDPWGGSEVDALYLTDTNRAYFYEIKCSKSDFLNDFKKKRHKLLLEKSDKINIKPKHFIYVCHGFEVSSEEIPEYAGLIMCDHRGLHTYPKPAKKAPVLWKEPLSSEAVEFINTKIMRRYLQSRHDIGRTEWRRLKKEGILN